MGVCKYPAVTLVKLINDALREECATSGRGGVDNGQILSVSLCSRNFPECFIGCDISSFLSGLAVEFSENVLQKKLFLFNTREADAWD
jgi:hypothetical protein